MSDRIAVMSGGNVLQVGAPRDIYDNPKSRFVADFIGESNLLSGSELGRGAGITVAVQPEFAYRPAPARSRAPIAAITFLGLDTIYDITLSGGTKLKARMREDAPALSVGAAIGIDWQHDAERELLN